MFTFQLDVWCFIGRAIVLSVSILRYDFSLACPFTANQIAFHGHYQILSRENSNVVFKEESVLRAFVFHPCFTVGGIKHEGIHSYANKHQT